MKVCSLKRYVEAFRALPDASQPISLHFSRPWHFNHTFREPIEFAKDSGIYIYTCPANPWDLALDQNAQDIWYIGMSDGGLAGRVWAHVGAIYDPPGSGVLCNPRFKYHQWTTVETVSDQIKTAIAIGNLVVYTIKVEAIGSAPGLAQALEKFLLACCFRVDGKLPPLNIDL